MWFISLTCKSVHKNTLNLDDDTVVSSGSSLVRKVCVWGFNWSRYLGRVQWRMLLNCVILETHTADIRPTYRFVTQFELAKWMRKPESSYVRQTHCGQKRTAGVGQTFISVLVFGNQPHWNCHTVNPELLLPLWNCTLGFIDDLPLAKR